MSTVAKSIIYAWPNAPTAPGNTASFGSKTLYFPETSSRVFKSVYTEISYHDSQSSGVNTLSTLAAQLKLSGSNTSSLLTFGPYNALVGGSTGEAISFVGGPFDFTNFFPISSATLRVTPSLKMSIPVALSFSLACPKRGVDIK